MCSAPDPFLVLEQREDIASGDKCLKAASVEGARDANGCGMPKKVRQCGTYIGPDHNQLDNLIMFLDFVSSCDGASLSDGVPLHMTSG